MYREKLPMKLQGIFADLATPFDHNGKIYRTKLHHNIEKWNRTALSGYVVCGHCGEGALLTSGERAEVWEQSAAIAGEGRIVIAGIGVPGVPAAAAGANRAAELGYAAVLAETPHYDPALAAGAPSLYYRCLADRSKIPVLISNRPRVTGIDLDAGAIVALSRHPNIAGVVDHAGDAGKIRSVCQGASPGFAVLTGSEQSIWQCLQAGASGAVLAWANPAPYTLITLWEAFRTREEDAGLDWQARIAHPAELVTTRYGVPGLKCAMDLNGYYGGPPRLPSSICDPAVRDEIARAMHDLKG